uniref:hypothetical protein n=1 Tax=Escherichia coli TaxID=562 RepID=UPI00200EA831
HGFISENDTPKFADHDLVFMIRGVCAAWRQPIAYYFCQGTIPASELTKILNKIVDAVKSTGLEPLAFICDQGMTFQSAIKNLQAATRQYQIKN